MGASSISGVGKNFNLGQTAGVKEDAKEKDIQLAFMEVMSQMQTGVGENISSDKQMMDAKMKGALTNKNADCEQYGNSRTRIKEAGVEPKAGCEQITEKTNKFAEDVKEVLKEELGVSEEQICEAMETLGLGAIDLLNTNQLALLVGELTGEESVGALLCNEQFMTVMQAVGELSEELLQELGISAEELSQLMQNGNDVLQYETDAQILPENMEAIQEQSVADVQQHPTESLQNGQEEQRVEENLGVVKTTKENATDHEEKVVENNLTTDEQENTSYEQKMLGDDNSSENSEENSHLLKQQSMDEVSVQSRSSVNGSMNQNFAEITTQMAEGVTETSSQVDVSNIIKQIVEFSKVTLNNATTTMEMQLNPEHLGKIYLSLTSKGGMVSAHIAAQNEAVKDAIESQMVVFKENMNQAGVKVDAVEVTVGSHEFERNLEQNAKQQQEQAEEQEKAAKQARHINLNDLDELNGVMTEEESLVAQMMADHGNSIDFTA